jgi:hypothetical protein
MSETPKMSHTPKDPEQALDALRDAGILAPDVTLDKLMEASNNLAQHAQDLEAAADTPSFITVESGGGHILVDSHSWYWHPPHPD